MNQADTIEKALQVHVLRHQQKKPSGGEELLHHFSGIRAPRIAFVGDRALTDVVYANNYGMLSILTRDIVTEEGDNPMAVRVSHCFFGVCTWVAYFILSDHPSPSPPIEYRSED